ncbi:hypothetical protein [Endozoicomonas sp.]|uniref:hypothetical protein n=1 Tax=Endozoicomonas sp. TaxID=1892382 RepID=UPI0028855E1C|nr:hypothetical protein [Endozoicomonas sp.]
MESKAVVRPIGISILKYGETTGYLDLTESAVLFDGRNVTRKQHKTIGSIMAHKQGIKRFENIENKYKQMDKYSVECLESFIKKYLAFCREKRVSGAALYKITPYVASILCEFKSMGSRAGSDSYWYYFRQGF